MSGMVVAAFPATGKSYFADHATGVVDSDSSSFSWKWITFDVRERHPEWPGNYMAHVSEKLASGALVLVSTHAEVRSALVDSGIPFTLVYPDVVLREEYRERMQRRGSPKPLIRKVIDELWVPALAECMAQRGCEHVVLGPGEYLSDALVEAAASNQTGREGASK